MVCDSSSGQFRRGNPLQSSHHQLVGSTRAVTEARSHAKNRTQTGATEMSGPIYREPVGVIKPSSYETKPA
jgi:hypothetical protein